MQALWFPARYLHSSATRCGASPRAHARQRLFCMPRFPLSHSVYRRRCGACSHHRSQFTSKVYSLVDCLPLVIATLPASPLSRRRAASSAVGWRHCMKRPSGGPALSSSMDACHRRVVSINVPLLALERSHAQAEPKVADHSSWEISLYGSLYKKISANPLNFGIAERLKVIPLGFNACVKGNQLGFFEELIIG